MSTQTVNSTRLEAITGISPRRLQLWSQQKILRPLLVIGRGSRGHQRRFGECDALITEVMMHLSRRGIAAKNNAGMVRAAAEQVLSSGWWNARIMATPQPEDLMLIVYGPCGAATFGGYIVSRAETLDTITRHSGPGFIIDLADTQIRRGGYFRARCVSK